MYQTHSIKDFTKVPVLFFKYQIYWHVLKVTSFIDKSNNGIVLYHKQVSNKIDIL
jgi:hypothetical protein